MLHSGHRKRIRTRLSSDGLDSFTDEQVLEYILTLAIPRKDVRPIAARLLETYGTLARVLEAPPEQLMQVEGIGEHTAILLGLVKGLSRKYLIGYEEKNIQLRTLEDCGKYLMDRFLGKRDESVMLLCLDAKRAPLCCRVVSEGSVNTAEVSVRKVVEAALAVNATSAVLAHNHPSGIALPSMEDIVTTRRMGMALDAVGITLEDHIVVAGRDYVSLAQSGYYDPENCRMIV